ncbi:TetR/AcrR family transcriptional regulator [Pelotomaculum schinkii]|nr:TetR/AcrR family transcriptional regulator [Pelotomaculum schinkii]
MNSRQKQSIETELKIVRTALSLMRKKGYENVGIREICDAAGISTGAFYHHFKSKEDMLNIGFGTYDEYLAEVLETYENPDPLEFLRFVLLNQTEYVMKQTGSLTSELYRALLSSNDKYAIDTFRLYYRTVRKAIELCLKEGKFHASFTADYLTEFLIRVVRGDIIDWCLHEYSYNLMEYVGKDLNVIFAGLCCKTE